MLKDDGDRKVPIKSHARFWSTRYPVITYARLRRVSMQGLLVFRQQMTAIVYSPPGCYLSAYENNGFHIAMR